MQKIYIRGKPEFQLDVHELLEVLRPLYGLADVGDYWHTTFLRHLKKDLGMTTTVSDLFLDLKRVQSTVQGLFATNVDKTLVTGDEYIRDETLETARKFDSKPREIGSFTFAGVIIQTKSDETRSMHQQLYNKHLKFVEKDCTFVLFVSRTQELVWIAHTLPGVSGDSALLAQDTEQLFKHAHIRKLIKAIGRVKDNPELGLRVLDLKKDKLRIIANSDESFANTTDYRIHL